MWARSTPNANSKIILFDYDPSRSSEAAKKKLSDYSGYVQVDGYAGYNFLEKQSGVTILGCNMHVLRYFEQAKVDGAKSGITLAEVGLKYYHTLYELEDESKKLNLDDKQKHRLEKHKPIWDEFKTWVELNIKKVPSKSKLGKICWFFSFRDIQRNG